MSKKKELAIHEKDTGSSEVQVAQLTDKIENYYDWRNEIDEGVAAALKVGSMIAPKIPSAVKAIGAGVATGASLLGIKKKDDEPIIKPKNTDQTSSSFSTIK